MHWQLLPALAAPGVMTLFRLGAHAACVSCDGGTHRGVAGRRL